MPDTAAEPVHTTSATAPRGFDSVRAALRFLFRRVVGIYFREVAITGDVPGPDTGGRVFAADHVNALVDPILVLARIAASVSGRWHGSARS